MYINYVGAFEQLHPPYLLSWIINCLENNSSETVTNLVEKITYKYEDFIDDIIIKDPGMVHTYWSHYRLKKYVGSIK